MRNNTAVVLSAIALALAGAACDSQDGSSSAVVRDSAGVQIVENGGHDWADGQGWRLADEPILDIGVLEGEAAYQLFGVVGALRLADGRIVVANSGSFELRFYDANGTYLQSIGREGGGPGEFASMADLSAMGSDSLTVHDRRNQRLTVFASDGSIGRSVQFRFLPEMGGFPVIVAPFADGSLFVGVRTYFGSGEIKSGHSRDEIIYLRCDAGGQLIDTLAVLPGGELNTIAEDNSVMVSDSPFGRYPRHVVHADGFFYGGGDRYEIDHYGNDGQLRRSLRRALPNMEVTGADVENYKREQLDEATDESRRQVTERLMAVASFPETFPAHGDIVVDADGNLWVAVYRRPGDDEPRWTVFDPSGQMLGVVKTPERFRVYQIGSDFMLGRWRDDLDVDHVLMFEIVKE